MAQGRVLTADRPCHPDQGQALRLYRFPDLVRRLRQAERAVRADPESEAARAVGHRLERRGLADAPGPPRPAARAVAAQSLRPRRPGPREYRVPAPTVRRRGRAAPPPGTRLVAAPVPAGAPPGASPSTRPAHSFPRRWRGYRRRAAASPGT